MKLQIKKFTLLAALQKTKPVLSGRALSPILANFFIEAEQGQLRVTASDSEITIIASTSQVDVSEAGSVIAPQALLDIVEACEDSVIDLSINSGQMVVSCGDAHWDVNINVAEEYPKPEVGDWEKVSFKKEDFKQALSRVTPAIKSDAVRPDLNYVQVIDGMIRATDGNKYIHVIGETPVELLLYVRIVDLLERRLRSLVSDEFEVGVSDDQYVFFLDEDVMMATRSTVKYPDANRYFLKPAENNDQSVDLDKRVLDAAIKRVRITADEETHHVSLILNENQLKLTAFDKYGSQSEEIIEIFWPHPPRTMGVNHKFLSDIIGALSTAQVNLAIGEDRGNHQTSLKFTEPGMVGILQQMRPDFNEATKGSDRVHGAQQEPEMWKAQQKAAARDAESSVIEDPNAPVSEGFPEEVRQSEVDEADVLGSNA